MTANEAIQATAQQGHKGEARREAEEFLKGYLENGPMPAAKVKEAAEDNAISPATLRRACKELKVVIEKTGFKDGWVSRFNACKTKLAA